jgi:hypothetical protein
MTDPSTTLSPGPHREAAPRRAEARLYGLMAEFTNPADLMHAAQRVREQGYRWWDCHTPFPVHGLDKAMGIRPTILPILVFCGGLTGACLAFFLQMFTNSFSFDLWVPPTWVRGYAFMISGKPYVSLPAFIPVAFELTVLLSALTTVGCVLLLNGLPRLYHPLFKSMRFARATDDRFFVVIEARDPKFARTKTEEFLRSLNPAAIEAVEA